MIHGQVDMPTIDPAECSFILPCNDGESKKIGEICRSLNLDLRISGQRWGASLDREPIYTFKNLKKDVVIVEMPGTDTEARLAGSGHHLIIIDHHIYRYGDKLLDRRNSKSSLEQFAELIGYSLNRFERGIALNDSGYIWLLRKEGYSDAEIDKIRRYDLEAQGFTEKEFSLSIEEYRKGQFLTDKKLFIVQSKMTKTAYIADMHQFKSSSDYDLLILHDGSNGLSEVNFYGNPDRCKRLFSRFGGWIGGDEAFSMFWGCKENLPDKNTILEGIDYESACTQ